MINQIFKSKTMWLALLLEIVGVIQLNAEELRSAIPVEYYGYFLIVVGVAVRVLRMVTTTSIGEK